MKLYNPIEIIEIPADFFRRYNFFYSFESFSKLFE